jgi:hypothetical protein
MVDENGKEFTMYTFFSNQRFSEFSQTWGHDDADGNLLMNFFAVTRENNPSWGTLQGGAYSIPGRNRFTILMREITDDTGVECYEITSMSQPIQVDINYNYSLITGKFKHLNEFNTKLNRMFESKQCYLSANGHYMPMTLDNISDVTDYTIDGRKFYMQTAEITVMAYLIPRDDIKVNIVPKRQKVTTNLKKYDRTLVTMDFDNDSEDKMTLNIKFSPNVVKVSFEVQDKMVLTMVDKKNANKLDMKVNSEDVDIYSDKITVCPNDEITIRIVQPNKLKTSEIVFKGVLLNN